MAAAVSGRGPRARKASDRGARTSKAAARRREGPIFVERSCRNAACCRYCWYLSVRVGISFLRTNPEVRPARREPNCRHTEPTQILRRFVFFLPRRAPLVPAPAAARPAPPFPSSKHLAERNRDLMRSASLVLFALIPAKSFVRTRMSISGWPAKRRRVSSSLAGVGGVKDEPQKGRGKQRQSASL